MEFRRVLFRSETKAGAGHGGRKTLTFVAKSKRHAGSAGEKPVNKGAWCALLGPGRIRGPYSAGLSHRGAADGNGEPCWIRHTPDRPGDTTGIGACGGRGWEDGWS